MKHKKPTAPPRLLTNGRTVDEGLKLMGKSCKRGDEATPLLVLDKVLARLDHIRRLQSDLAYRGKRAQARTVDEISETLETYAVGLLKLLYKKGGAR